MDDLFIHRLLLILPGQVAAIVDGTAASSQATTLSDSSCSSSSVFIVVIGRDEVSMDLCPCRLIAVPMIDYRTTSMGSGHLRSMESILTAAMRTI